ncbi:MULTISPECIES: hypothetical protein [Streptomyces]|uniref:Uncharacterized protein n=1 Tax=Streptomyces doudnae TaxID=3075536 RepID=A0ABD5EPW7_9ACTN|nr:MULTISPECIES: hypothetical protein [unclassified Streptomyces]MDT0436742.1 hypothetical protein [Streptomyces sp. DSM 41981]MYQ67459.1 hypothetical protein [Streptomyces sp. SID4950]SCE35310.1 hypothetical protein GA0115242_132619 [Streptomyces sp. SolWspMP-5a-2]
MRAVVKTRRIRMTAIGAACAAALLAGGASATVASAADHPAAPASPSAMTPHKAKITVKSDKHAVKARETVRLTGSTTGLKNGEKLTVQHYKNGKWTTLHSSTTVRKHMYSTDVKLTEKGTWKLRVVHGDTHSATTTVKVS